MTSFANGQERDFFAQCFRVNAARTAASPATIVHEMMFYLSIYMYRCIY